MKTSPLITVQLHTRPIDCPEHFGRHKAVLYRWPHRFAGIWECPESGVSDVHEHTAKLVETVIEDRLGFNGHYQTERDFYICALDGVTIDLDVADPLLDRGES